MLTFNMKYWFTVFADALHAWFLLKLSHSYAWSCSLIFMWEIYCLLKGTYQMQGEKQTIAVVHLIKK